MFSNDPDQNASFSISHRKERNKVESQSLVQGVQEKKTARISLLRIRLYDSVDCAVSIAQSYTTERKIIASTTHPQLCHDHFFSDAAHFFSCFHDFSVYRVPKSTFMV